MKMIVTIIPTDLVTNSLSSLFCPFIETTNKNHIFRKLVWSGNEKQFSLFLKSESCSTLQVYQIQQIFLIKGFSYMLFLLVLQFHDIISTDNLTNLIWLTLFGYTRLKYFLSNLGCWKPCEPPPPPRHVKKVSSINQYS